MQQSNYIKNNLKCIQYYHIGHLESSSLLESLEEQTEVSFVPQTQNPADHFKRKRLTLTPTSKSLLFID